MQRRLVPIIGLVLLGVSAVVAGPRVWLRWTTPRGRCPVCLRHEHRDSAVTFRAEGEPPITVCCLGCAMSYGRQTGKAVTIIAVTDYLTGRSLDPHTATFVIGSEVSPCTHAMPDAEPQREVHWDRCLPSILAFPSHDAAESFAQQHGGQLRSLSDLTGTQFDPGAAACGVGNDVPPCTPQQHVSAHEADKL